jgi:hypothetical protein
VAFNMTLLSYMGNLDVGINIDEAAVESPDLLRESLEQSFRELVALAPEAPRPATDTSTPPPPPPPAAKRRWFRRSR